MKRTFQNTSFPLEAEYLYRRGMELVNQKRDEEAAVVLRQVVFLSPGFTRACIELGDCMTRMGRRDEAWKYYTRVLRLDPSRSECILGKISLYTNPSEPDGPLALSLL